MCRDRLAARMRRHSVVLGVILAIGFILRLTVALGLGDVAKPVSGAYDQVSYDMLAQRLLQGHGLSYTTDWYPFTKAN